MKGNWNFSKESPASPNDLDLKTNPNCIRPETHWWQEVTERVGSDDRLWFSLQLSVERAEELCDAFAGWELSGRFGELITGGALMAPASYTALRIAIAAARDDSEAKPDPMDQMLGTDLLVPPGAYHALQGLVDPGALEITDAGLAVGTKKAPAPIEFGANVVPQSTVPKGAIPRSPVIIAIIDDGIGIANQRFRKAPSETRVEHFLDLSLAGKPTAGGAVDELLGRSWKAEDIDNLLAQYPDDEERVYRALGLIGENADLFPPVTNANGDLPPPPLREAVTHGTHMLDTAAGYDWRTEQEALADRPIIAVQPPLQAADNRSEPWMPLALKRALDWILVKADELSAKINDDKMRLPLIVNCSFSRMAGPQDGWSDVERRIAQFVRTYRAGGPPELCTMVMSASNTLQSRGAARVQVDKDLISLPWRVLPDDIRRALYRSGFPPSPGTRRNRSVSPCGRPGRLLPECFRCSTGRWTGRSAITCAPVYTIKAGAGPQTSGGRPSRSRYGRPRTTARRCRNQSSPPVCGISTSSRAASCTSRSTSTFTCNGTMPEYSGAARGASPISTIRLTRTSNWWGIGLWRMARRSGGAVARPSDRKAPSTRTAMATALC